MLADKTMPHPHIKIIDFGLAHRLKQGEEYRSLSGTPQYIGKWNIPHVYCLCLFGGNCVSQYVSCCVRILLVCDYGVYV